MPDSTAAVERLDVTAYEIPTDRPESDGTLEWDSTTIVVVQAFGGDGHGLGYTYGPASAADVIAKQLSSIVTGSDILDPQRTWRQMRASLRNAGQPGIGALALSAVDLALHDLRARTLGLPLSRLLGAVRDEVPIYGSGGFTSYDAGAVAEQLGAWRASGIERMKIKVGRDPLADLARLTAARDAIGAEAALMVDANGAFTPREALAWADRYREFGVDYFEEPVSSDDVSGLRQVREGCPASVAVAAGEYSWSLFDTRRLLDAEAVDIVQADITRCGGITEFLRIDALCAAHNRPFSAHCAPAISVPACCALHQLEHIEYFHDHIRIERILFDGLPVQSGGSLVPAEGAVGNGLELRTTDAARYRVWP